MNNLSISEPDPIPRTRKFPIKYDIPPDKPCPTCGSVHRWENTNNILSCAVCCPNTNPEAVFQWYEVIDGSLQETKVKLTDTLSRDISALIPPTAPTSTQEADHGIEFIFRTLLRAVKKIYPTDCRNKKLWVLTTWIILVEFANPILDSGTEYRKAVIWELVDRFKQAFKTLQDREADQAV